MKQLNLFEDLDNSSVLGVPRWAIGFVLNVGNEGTWCLKCYAKTAATNRWKPQREHASFVRRDQHIWSYVDSVQITAYTMPADQAICDECDRKLDHVAKEFFDAAAQSF